LDNKHPHYWKVKAAVLEAQIVQAQAERSVREARARQLAAMTEAGLDPQVDYEFIDADESIRGVVCRA